MKEWEKSEIQIVFSDEYDIITASPPLLDDELDGDWIG